jgi:hypothetical protein
VEIATWSSCHGEVSCQGSARLFSDSPLLCVVGSLNVTELKSAKANARYCVLEYRSEVYLQFEEEDFGRRIGSNLSRGGRLGGG